MISGCSAGSGASMRLSARPPQSLRADIHQRPERAAVPVEGISEYRCVELGANRRERLFVPAPFVTRTARRATIGVPRWRRSPRMRPGATGQGSETLWPGGSNRFPCRPTAGAGREESRRRQRRRTRAGPRRGSVCRFLLRAESPSVSVWVPGSDSGSRAAERGRLL